MPGAFNFLSNENSLRSAHTSMSGTTWMDLLVAPPVIFNGLDLQTYAC